MSDAPDTGPDHAPPPSGDETPPPTVIAEGIVEDPAPVEASAQLRLLEQIRDHLAAIDMRITAALALFVGGGATASAGSTPTVTTTPLAADASPESESPAKTEPTTDEDDAPRGTPLSAFRVAPPATALNLGALGDLDKAVRALPVTPAQA